MRLLEVVYFVREEGRAACYESKAVDVEEDPEDSRAGGYELKLC